MVYMATLLSIGCHKKTYNDNPDALVSHYLNTGYLFDFYTTKIKHYKNNYFKRCVLEMIQIKSDPYSINFRIDTDTQNLSSSYAQLIQTVKA